MTSPKTTSALRAPDPQRQELAYVAVAEIESICSVLLRELQSIGPEDLAWRGLVLRVKALNSVTMSAIGNDHGRDTAEMHLVVHGERMEAAHA